ncbi:MAG: D-alanyl-D-alanine carboxypeptidase/D-alanyl-D-alanine-endopeptidase [Planctomycetes bacterium]|nr:D-alanyl-D-alanine carboxypeptidase/D-alanyl-D-alanine-endopeptidase [Planctomycetota bacterium]
MHKRNEKPGPASRYTLGGSRVFAAAVAAILVAAPAHAGIARAIDAALASVPHARTHVSACVIDVQNGANVYDRNADTALIPASSMKVFAMAAALIELGENFEFETVLARDGNNLYLIGDGDPSLGDEKLCKRRGDSVTGAFERWADRLVSSGVTRVSGDLVFDGSIFDHERFNTTWEEKDLDNWYAAPVGGLNFNDNCVDVTLHPSATSGELVSVTVSPRCSIIEIANKCKSGGKGPPVLRHAFDSFQYKISGRCPKRWPFGPVSFPDPEMLTADVLRTVLRDKGIVIEGRIRRDRVRQADGSLPPGLAIVATYTTSIADILNRAGKNSQNLFAEALMKRTGYEWLKRKGVQDPRGGWVPGRQAVVEMLDDAGIDIGGFAVADGSGLSRENRCTARQLAGVLYWMSKRPEGALLCNSLSVAGVDGSLEKRLQHSPGVVFGKTGTMRGVRTLCGYIMPHTNDETADASPHTADGSSSSNKPRFAFCIMFNGYPGASTPYREIQDRICHALINAASIEVGTK